MTFDQVLQALRPGKSYVNPDNVLAHVVWEDGVVPPTQAEYDAAAVDVIEVSAFRLKLLVERQGKTATLLQALQQAGGDALFYWNNMQVADNQQPRVKRFAPAIGLNTQAEIDAFFSEARDMDVSS